MDESPVLVVGGGPVGLTLAIDLAQRGVRSILVNNRPAPGILPRMERCNARTMEHFRRLGIADEVRAVGYPVDMAMDVVITRSLVSEPLVRHEYPSVAHLRAQARAVNDGSTPAEPYQLVSQFSLEPVLLEAAKRCGVDVRFGWTFTGLAQDDAGVTSSVSGPDGQSRQIRTQYVVGCDGAKSAVRDQIGARLIGNENDEGLVESEIALFYSEELFEKIPIAKARHYHIADDFAAGLVVQGDRRHFSLGARLRGRMTLQELFERVVGFPFQYETKWEGTWRQRLELADRYWDRRVFIAGDAAHLVIPTGGLGMNTGIGDAIDLAWKIAAVLGGWGGPRLLASYEQERRPVGERNIGASRFANKGRQAWRQAWSPLVYEQSPEGERARQAFREVVDVEQRKSNTMLGIELGYRYVASPLIAHQAGGPDPDAIAYTPTTHPGARIPHVWIDGVTPIQDVLGLDGYSLVLAMPRMPWVDELAAEFGARGVPFKIVDVPDPEARATYGHAALLVRPDLHVAWRGNAAPDDIAALTRLVTGG